jgi:ribonuclease D
MQSAPEPIRDAAGVERIAGAAREAGRLALDFEFLWERTYRPLPCLAQVAVGEDLALVDPIEGAALEPLAELVAEPEVTVVMHAPPADLTLLALAFGTRPRAIVDTQLAAGFVGLGASQSLGTLVERVLRVRLSKSESYTDWSRRPLSAAQLRYAADDVRYLLPLADELARRAGARGRAQWVAEEHARRYGPESSWVTDPDAAWRRVKGQGRLTPVERAVLRRLAAWRERQAMRRDRPVGWTMPDRTLVELARRRPADEAALRAERGMPDRLRPAELRELLDAIRAGAGDPPIALGRAPAPEIQARMDVLGPLAQVLVAARAGAVDLAPTLVATRDEVEGFLVACLDGGAPDLPLGRGWRHELVGEALERLARGQLALAPASRAPYLEEIVRNEG